MLEELAKISENALMNIMRNIVDQRRVIPKTDSLESIGDLIGLKRNEKYIIVNSYPWPNVSATNKTCTYQDYWAKKEGFLIDKKLREAGLHKYHIIGQYHSHIIKPDEERGKGLSKEKPGDTSTGDIPFFRVLMKKLSLDETIQILSSVRIKDTDKIQEIDERTIEYKNTIRIIWKAQQRTYDAIFNAFVLNLMKNPREIPLRKI